MSIVRCPVCHARREAVQVWALGRDLWQVKHVGPALFALDGPCPAQLAESSVLAVSREALEQEFGEEIASKPGYPQMQARITRTILGDARYREMMEEFLQILLGSERPATEGTPPTPDA